MKKIILCLLILCSFVARASEGMISSPSQFSVDETASRFENILKEKGLTLFAKIDHTANAASVEQKIRPTIVIIFGNPKVGTPLMQCAQKAAIDLPQKVLFWQDENGKVWLSYNDPQYLKDRHEIENCDPIITKITKVLNMLSQSATSK
jgi:uncharacterized protein (DUF302 family)